MLNRASCKATIIKDMTFDKIPPQQNDINFSLYVYYYNLINKELINFTLSNGV
jgi:hypothetical protein